MPLDTELAVIKPFEHVDKLTKDKISIRVSPFYTILAINQREYYFLPETGEFDGTSMPSVQSSEGVRTRQCNETTSQYPPFPPRRHEAQPLPQGQDGGPPGPHACLCCPAGGYYQLVHHGL